MAPPPNLRELLETAIFPGVTIAESRLMRGYFYFHGAEWDEIDVEPKIGRGTLLPPTYSEKERTDWEKRTRARPDAILKRAPNIVAILEAKEQLTNEGVWQVLAYRDLWLADHSTDQVIPIAIAEGITPTASVLVKSQGVQVFLYEPAPRALATDRPTEAPS
jgi:hypothetical protein